ncbi:MAG: hemolysin family protein [Deltaproteobacteria bacterium]|jgi:CBS domain containing-hemolysin-like protein|nr:hemolysin family protein [Deltaproteobacteria bacterium]
MDIAIKLLLAAFLVLLNAMFVAAEFAFVRVRKTRLELLAQRGSARARLAIFGQAHLEDYLSVCQLGITLASLGLGWLGEPAVASLIRPAMERLGLAGDALMGSLAFMIGFGLITFVHVTFGELAPKNLSIRAAERTVLLLAYPMRAAHVLFRPFVTVLNASAQLVLTVIGAGRWASSPAYSTEELKLMIAESRDGGQLDEVEERLLNNIFNMDRRTARDIMVHRTKVVSVSADAPPSQALELSAAAGHTRLPVYDGDRDNMTGFVHSRDLTRRPGLPAIRSLVRPALYIYESLAADDVLELMRGKRSKLGLVWDEYGSYLGLITMEDVLEAIVGEIQDEFDLTEGETIEDLQDGWTLCQTTVSLDELGRHTPLWLAADTEESYRTLAALLAGRFSETPRAGDSWTGYGAEFVVVSADGPAVSKVRVRSLPKEEDGQDPPSEKGGGRDPEEA